MDVPDMRRTSETWRRLRPYRDSQTIKENDESELEYHRRIENEFTIPFEVVQQWLYPLYFDATFTNNYGWIDYSNVSFNLCSLPAGQLADVNVIAEFQNHVDNRSDAVAFSDFTGQHRADWQNKRTWRTPPIVIDVNSLGETPEHAELHGPLQLVEGHTRLGYLRACIRCGVISNESSHTVFVLRVSKGKF